MLLLVLAGNFLLLIVGWAFVGAASYLLISLLVPAHDGDAGGHQGVRDQRRRRRRARARHLLHLPRTRARSTCSATFASVDRARSPTNDGDLVAGCLLLLVGAFAKSAQVPLHTWLPDAMEGPTPVSALIHAATMVTAGVYLIARMHPLFEQAPAAADVGAIVGCATLLIAATIALVADRPQARDRLLDDVADRLHDHGRLGRAPTSAGLFHLMTHAFFKALLFMARRLGDRARWRGEQSLDRMGGFRKAMPFTFACFIIGGLALAGHPAVLGLLLQGRDPAAASASAAAGTGCSTWPATSARS